MQSWTAVKHGFFTTQTWTLFYCIRVLSLFTFIVALVDLNNSDFRFFSSEPNHFVSLYVLSGKLIVPLFDDFNTKGGVKLALVESL